jgi:acetyl-CoA C-acetyltransferase
MPASLAQDPVVIVNAKRSPMGAFQGALSYLMAPKLAAPVLKSLLQGTSVTPEQIHEVYMGCVLTAGLGQAPARQAALFAEFPYSTSCTTLNKVCGSGMKAVMLGCADLLENPEKIVVAGGMESMSNAPYLLDKARVGYRMGHHRTLDHMLFDGLEDAYEPGRLMGTFAEDTAARFGFTREAQDAFAIASVTKALQAIEKGWMKQEITPITVANGKETLNITEDETPLRVKLDKIPSLKPAFKPEGTVTAASSSSLADGAAALLLMRQSLCNQQGLKPLAVIQGWGCQSQEPAWFTTAPIGAIQKSLEKAGWDLNAVDLFEINEAFAVVTMAAMQELKLPKEKVNIHGGACALGHPLGASGARLLVTLIHALHTHRLQKGIAALCIGGGEGIAMAIELP